MDNIVYVIVGPALVAGGVVLYLQSTWSVARALGASAGVAGAIMAFIGWVNALSGTG
ncbi:MAG: hypothetical protein IH957_09445 [Chloroflexi bacterium]|nr:hypothetical protein [Chloroflexota bacterium]